MKTLSIVLTLAAVSFSAFVSAQEPEQGQPSSVLIQNVKIYDGLKPRLISGQDVLVEGNLIKDVGSNLDIPRNTTVIDGGGRTLTPGLIDSHTHLAFVSDFNSMQEMEWGELGARMTVIAEDQLMRGFTTVRDTCGNTHGLRNAINKGVIPGPRIYSSGACISATSGHGDFGSYNKVPGTHYLDVTGSLVVADGPDEVRKAIRNEFRKGASFIKLMIGGGLASPFDPLDTTTFQIDELKAAVRETEGWGTYATAHIYTDQGIMMGLDAGMRTFEHTHLASREVYERFKKEGIVISAQVHAIGQLVGYAGFTTAEQNRKAGFLAQNGTKTFEYIKELDLPVGFGADFWGEIPSQRINSAAIAGRKKYFSNDMILEQLFANNVKLLEMTGERNPYKEGPLGVIAKGAYADLLLVEGDPTADVAVFSDWENKIDLVMKDGVIYKQEL